MAIGGQLSTPSASSSFTLEVAAATGVPTSGCPADIFGAASALHREAMEAVNSQDYAQAKILLRQACTLNPFQYRCGVDQARVFVDLKEPAGGLGPIKQKVGQYRNWFREGLLAPSHLAALLDTFSLELMTSKWHSRNPQALQLAMALLNATLVEADPDSVVAKLMQASARLATSRTVESTKKELVTTIQLLLLYDGDNGRDAQGNAFPNVFLPLGRQVSVPQVLKQLRGLVDSIQTNLDARRNKDMSEL